MSDARPKNMKQNTSWIPFNDMVDMACIFVAVELHFPSARRSLISGSQQAKPMAKKRANNGLVMLGNVCNQKERRFP